MSEAVRWLNAPPRRWWQALSWRSTRASSTSRAMEMACDAKAGDRGPLDVLYRTSFWHRAALGGILILPRQTTVRTTLTGHS